MSTSTTRSWEHGALGRTRSKPRVMVDLSAKVANLSGPDRRAVMTRLQETQPDIAAFVQAAGRVFGKVQLSVDPETAREVMP